MSARRVRKFAAGTRKKDKSYCENTKKPAISFSSFVPFNQLLNQFVEIKLRLVLGKISLAKCKRIYFKNYFLR